MGVVRPREAVRIPPTPSICVVTRAPGEGGPEEGGGGCTTLCYLFINFRLWFFCLFVCLLVVFSEADSHVFVSPFQLAFPCPRCFLCVPRFSIVAEFNIPLPCLFWSFFFFVIAFCSSFALSSSRFVFCFVFFPSRSRKSCGERERERERERETSFCFWLWIEVLLLIAELRSWLEEEAEEGVKKKAESLLAMIHAVSLLRASWSARV